MMKEIIKEMIPYLAEMVVAVIGLVVSTYVIPWLKNKNLYESVRRFVLAAEKLSQNSKIEKKEWVITQLQKNGIKVGEVVELMIESAVEEIDVALGVKKKKQ